MILRNITVRHGRKTLAGPLRILRTLTTEFPSETPSAIEHSIDNHAKELSSIEYAIDQLNLTPQGVAASFQGKGANVLPNMKASTAKLGSIVKKHFEPHQLVQNPPKPEEISLELFMASQSHMGHSTSLWNPANQRYIYGIRQGIHIISLETTAAHLRRAAKVVESVAYHGGLILFVGTRPGQSHAVVRAAGLAKGCHLFQRWIPGTITNGGQILRKCPIEAIDEFDKPVDGFEEKLSGWGGVKPDLVVVMNPLENYILLHECGINDIPTMAVIDTDADPTWVTYPIPANDDSLRCIELIAGALGRAGEEGHRKRLAAAKSGKITWEPPPRLGTPATIKDDAEVEESLPNVA